MKKVRNIFLIDDDKDDQEVFAIALNEVDESIVCSTARDGVEAMDILHASVFFPDCIFLDLNMPRMNGKQCLKEIKGMEELKNIPIFVYSTSSSSGDMRETLGMGANAFITKPSELKTLVRVLKDIFSTLEK